MGRSGRGETASTRGAFERILQRAERVSTAHHPREEVPTAAEGFSFKSFSEHAFYKQMNEWLVDHARLKPGWTVVDLACGTGQVARLVAERIRGGQQALLIAVDLSYSTLKEAMGELADVRDVAIEFVAAKAEEFAVAVREAAQAVVLCNAIHYVADKPKLIANVAQNLRQGGIFAFNTAFFMGCTPPETEPFYRRWMMKALRTLVKEYGLRPTTERVEARHQLTPREYRELLEAGGFSIEQEELLTAPMTLQGWKDISRFEDFVQGALPGIPVATASRVLCDALEETFEELEIDIVPRRWLSVVAVRA